MNTKTYPWLTEPQTNFKDWLPPTEFADTPFAERRMFFERHESHRNSNVVCPACGYPTLQYRYGYDNCPLCHWEDDGQDDPWADRPNGGPNDHSLTQARKNFAETYSVWSLAEAEDFSENNRYRLFSENAYREKRQICQLYDALLKLKTDEQIQHQWELIDAQWKSVP